MRLPSRGTPEMGGGGVHVTGFRRAAEILYHQEEKVLGWGGGNFGGPLGFPLMGHFPYKSDLPALPCPTVKLRACF